jgi:hypothetical protein
MKCASACLLFFIILWYSLDLLIFFGPTDLYHWMNRKYQKLYNLNYVLSIDSINWLVWLVSHGAKHVYLCYRDRDM